MSDPKPRTLWVVTGEQGKYSDYKTWIVAIYDNEEAAKLHAEQANAAVPANHSQDFYDNPFDRSKETMHVSGWSIQSSQKDKPTYGVLPDIVFASHPDQYQDIVAELEAENRTCADGSDALS